MAETDAESGTTARTEVDWDDFVRSTEHEPDPDDFEVAVVEVPRPNFDPLSLRKNPSPRWETAETVFVPGTRVRELIPVVEGEVRDPWTHYIEAVCDRLLVPIANRYERSVAFEGKCSGPRRGPVNDYGDRDGIWAVATAIVESVPYLRAAKERLLDEEKKRLKQMKEEQLRVIQREAEELAEIERLEEIERLSRTRGNFDSFMEDDEDDGGEVVIPDMLMAGEVVIFTGENGAGKSTALAQLAAMCAGGHHPVTRLTMPKRRVLYVELQTPKRDVRANFRKMPIKPDPDFLRVENFSAESFIIYDASTQRRLRTMVEEFEPELLILGPIANLADHEISSAMNSEKLAMKLFATVRELRSITDFALILEGHHGNETATGRPKGSAQWHDTPAFGIKLDRKAESSEWRPPRDADRPWPVMRWTKPGDGHEYPWHFRSAKKRTAKELLKEEMWRYIDEHPGATQEEIGNHVDRSAATVNGWIKEGRP
jgi:metallophosphoesterase superfamily enzyme